LTRTKYGAWNRQKQHAIIGVRQDAGYNSTGDFSEALYGVGMKTGKDAYLRRERGETPVSADEIWYYSYLLKIPVMETLALFSRMPDDSNVALYAENAMKQFREANGS